MPVLPQMVESSEEFQRDIQFFYCAVNRVRDCSEDVLLFPASEHNPYDGTSPHPEVLENRALTLFKLTQAKPMFVLMPTRSLVQRTPQKEEIAKFGANPTVSKDLAPESLVEMMVAGGYIREDPVADVGQFSLRGGIMDVFSPAHKNPLRIEFFGDTVETIREFDPETQRSIQQLETCEIVPLREFLASRNDLRKWAQSAHEYWAEEKYAHELRGKATAALDGETFTGWEYLVALEKPPQSSIFEYLQDAVLVIDEPSECDKRITELLADLEERFNISQDAGELALPPSALFLTADELRARIDGIQRLEFRVLGQSAGSVDAEFAIDSAAVPITVDEEIDKESSTTEHQPSVAVALAQFAKKRQKLTPLFLFPTTPATPEVYLSSQSVRRFHGHVDTLSQELRNLTAAASQVFCVMPSIGVAERLAEMLREYNIQSNLRLDMSVGEESQYSADSELAVLPITVTVGKLTNGFTIQKAGLSFFTEPDLFDETSRTVELRQARPTRKRAKSAPLFQIFVT